MTNETEPKALYEVTANGFTAVTDAFALRISDDEDKDIQSVWMLSMLGNQSSLKAISASLTKMTPEELQFKSTEYSPENRLNIRATRSHNSGSWRSKMIRLPLSRAWHCLAYPAQAEFHHQPKRSSSFLILAAGDSGTPQASHHRFLNTKVKIPIHPNWTGWLWSRGISKGEIHPLKCYGRIEAWICTPDEDELREDITTAIKTGLIS